MTVNQFQVACFIFCSFSWAGQGVVAFERDKMLLGQPANMVYFDLYSTNSNLGGMLPSDSDGPAPPDGSPNYFVEVDDNAWGYSPDQLGMWQFHVDWTKPSNSTFINPFATPASPLAGLATAAFDSNMCGYARNCIPQPGTTTKLDAISDRLMYRLQYRNFSTYQTLVVNHTVDVDGTDHAGIRWYELRNSGGGWAINQQGTFSPDSNHRWMGSIAMDKNGNIALGYSVSSGSIFPSIRYAGRVPTDSLGTMGQGETALLAGGGSQTHSSSRWGDYSMMAVDPSDDCTFWYTTEYYSATSSASWRTRIGSFKFPSCGVPASGADLSVSKTDAPDPVTAGSNLTYTITVSNNGPDPAINAALNEATPANTNFQSIIIPAGWSCPTLPALGGTGSITCMNPSLALGSSTFTLVVQFNASTANGTTITNTATVSSSTSDPNTANNTSTGATAVQAPTSGVAVMGITPNSTKAGTTMTNVKINGTGYVNGAAVKFENGTGPTPKASSIVFVDGNNLTVTVAVKSGGPRVNRAWDVRVTNPDTSSGVLPGGLTVTP